MPNQEICCTVKDCRYNSTQSNCTLPKIDVKPGSGDITNCKSFLQK